MANMRGGNAEGSLCCWMAKDLFYATTCFSLLSQNVEQNIIFTYLVVKVVQSNATK